MSRLTIPLIESIRTGDSDEVRQALAALERALGALGNLDKVELRLSNGTKLLFWPRVARHWNFLALPDEPLNSRDHRGIQADFSSERIRADKTWGFNTMLPAPGLLTDEQYKSWVALGNPSEEAGEDVESESW